MGINSVFSYWRPVNKDIQPPKPLLFEGTNVAPAGAAGTSPFHQNNQSFNMSGSMKAGEVGLNQPRASQTGTVMGTAQDDMYRTALYASLHTKGEKFLGYGSNRRQAGPSLSLGGGFGMMA